MLGDPDESQDVAQDAFLKGMTRIDSLKDGSQFASWLIRIAQNLCRDHWRRQQRRQRLLRENIEELIPERGTPLPDLSGALARLPEKYRIPLMLYYFDGQSSENVARALELSRAGAGTRLARARQALRRLLEKNHE
jgi:RNA polymerase sigma-70 factor (ECF subfamily)